MSTYRDVALIGIRSVVLIGILPGAIVAAAYLLVLTGELAAHWDAQTALVLGMAVWGVLGVAALWREYLHLSRNRSDIARRVVGARTLLFVWALMLVALSGWQAKAHPWIAAFLALAALHSFGRAVGLLGYRARPRRGRAPGAADQARSQPRRGAAVRRYGGSDAPPQRASTRAREVSR